MTFGERAVGLNPSGDKDVAKINALFAEIIDFCNEERGGAEGRRNERARLFSRAIDEAQVAQMLAIKAIAWSDE